MPAGRPKKDKYKIDYMMNQINQYTEDANNIIPILKECCLLNDWNYDYVMELQRNNPELSQSIKRLLDWKEVKLEQGALTGKFDKTMVIFTLKQPAHGWTDRHEVEVSKNTSGVIDEIDKYVSEGNG